MVQNRRLRIGIDAHAIGERRTGNERFIANVLRELRDLCDHEFVLFFTSTRAAHEWAGWHSRVIRPRSPWLRIPFSLPMAARRERLDVLLTQYTAPRWPGCPVVTVVHDVSFAEHPEFFTGVERLWMPRTIPATMRRAERVVTVSEFSKGEIQRIYGVPEAKIVVAPDGVDPVLVIESAPNGSEPYFLFVGTTSPRKNLQTLLSAFASMRRRNPEVRERLKVVGPGEPGQPQDGVEYLGYVDDPQLAGLLQHATALCFPSIYEGFGLPPLEAMAVGTRVLVSDIPAMREVCGEAASYLTPNDAEAWTGEMLRSATDLTLRTSSAEIGRKRASEFTWTRTARAVLSALEEAVS